MSDVKTTYMERVLIAFGYPDAEDDDTFHRIAKKIEFAKGFRGKYQAARKLFYGTTKAFKGSNNVAVARAANCNPDWLATGEGPREIVDPWPFPYVKRDRYDKLENYYKVLVQKAMNDALDLIAREAIQVQVARSAAPPALPGPPPPAAKKSASVTKLLTEGRKPAKRITRPSRGRETKETPPKRTPRGKPKDQGR